MKDEVEDECGREEKDSGYDYVHGEKT